MVGIESRVCACLPVPPLGDGCILIGSNHGLPCRGDKRILVPPSAPGVSAFRIASRDVVASFPGSHWSGGSGERPCVTQPRPSAGGRELVVACVVLL